MVIRRNDRNFRDHLYTICEIIPIVRSFATQIERIEFHKGGLLFLDQKGDKIATISRHTFLKAKQDLENDWKS